MEAERGDCDPAVGVVVMLAEGVPSPCASDSQFGVDGDELAAGVDDLGAIDLGFQTLQSMDAPAAEECAIAELGDSLE